MKKKIHQQWWLYVIIAIIIITICISSTLSIKYICEKDNLNNLSKEIKQIYNDCNIYSSQDTLFIEFNNYSNEKNSEQLKEILSKIKNNVENNKFKKYKKLITIAYINSKESEDLIIRNEHEMPEMTKKSGRTYIDFKEYTDLFDKYSNAMNGYTNLFNSIK